jgi:serine/threonine protein kinase
MGVVYRARDTRLMRDVALKIVPDEFAIDPDRLARLTREAQLLASLNHPNIAQIPFPLSPHARTANSRSVNGKKTEIRGVLPLFADATASDKLTIAAE